MWITNRLFRGYFQFQFEANLRYLMLLPFCTSRITNSFLLVFILKFKVKASFESLFSIHLAICLTLMICLSVMYWSFVDIYADGTTVYSCTKCLDDQSGSCPLFWPSSINTMGRKLAHHIDYLKNQTSNVPCSPSKSWNFFCRKNGCLLNEASRPQVDHYILQSLKMLEK